MVSHVYLGLSLSSFRQRALIELSLELDQLRAPDSGGAGCCLVWLRRFWLGRNKKTSNLKAGGGRGYPGLLVKLQAAEVE